MGTRPTKTWLRGDDNFISVLYLHQHIATYQGCAGRPFIPRGGAKVKIHGAGRGEGENPRGGAKKRANQPIQKFYKSAKNIILHIIILIII